MFLILETPLDNLFLTMRYLLRGILMNHWFLVGRDLMWLILAVWPVVGFSLARWIEKDSEGQATELSLLVYLGAVFIQGFGIAAFYSGAIK